MKKQKTKKLTVNRVKKTIGEQPHLGYRFLDAAKHLYKRVCLSVCRSITLFSERRQGSRIVWSGIRTCLTAFDETIPLRTEYLWDIRLAKQVGNVYSPNG